jgi:hypothetical protein
MQITKRSIRKSGYGDYFAIDEITEQQKVIETPLYLRKNEEKKVKIRWEWETFNSSGTHPQNCMLDGFIRFDGTKVEMCYAPETMQSSGGKKDWFEPSDYELINKSITHFKL